VFGLAPRSDFQGMADVIQPQYMCETNYETFQAALPNAIKMAAKFPSAHPQKVDRLDAVAHLIKLGADPMMVMEIYGEEVTPMQRAIEYGDPQTIKCVRDAMTVFAKKPPLILYSDIDSFQDDQIVKKLPVALIFPGTGSQYVGMLKEVKDLEPCQVLIEKANSVLGYDILDLCMNGPEEKLEDTRYCQPAMFLANACAVEKLRMNKPDLVSRVQAAGGLDVGEYNAVHFSGMMDFELTMRMVRARADACAAEVKKTPQATISIAGLDLQVVKRLCEEAAKKAGTMQDGQEEICQVAQQLFPKGYTCAGTKKAVEILKAAAEKNGALQARYMKVPAAFHTPVMASAGSKLNKALRANIGTMTFPQVDVYTNVRGSYQRAGTDPREINMDLTGQVSNQVLWSGCIEAMIGQGITEFYECGPMKQLKAMMKRINQDAWEKTTSVPV